MDDNTTKTPFQRVVDELTDGCGCACHTGTGYRSSCAHCLGMRGEVAVQGIRESRRQHLSPWGRVLLRLLPRSVYRQVLREYDIANG